MEELGEILTKKCSRCKEVLPITHFYRSNTKIQGTCKKCESIRTVSRSSLRQVEWEARGKKCERCGIEGKHSFFDFHHVVPELKEISINKVWYYGKKRRDAELAKCIMVCPNCHRQLHMELSTFGLTNKHKELKDMEDPLNDKTKDKTAE